MEDKRIRTSSYIASSRPTWAGQTLPQTKPQQNQTDSTSQWGLLIQKFKCIFSLKCGSARVLQITAGVFLALASLPKCWCSVVHLHCFVSTCLSCVFLVCSSKGKQSVHSPSSPCNSENKRCDACTELVIQNLFCDCHKLALI